MASGIGEHVSPGLVSEGAATEQSDGRSKGLVRRR